MEAQIPAFSLSSSPPLKESHSSQQFSCAKALVSVALAQFCPPRAVLTYQGNEGHSHKFQFTVSTYVGCFRRCLFKHCQNQSKLPQTRKGGEQGNTRHLLGAESSHSWDLAELSQRIAKVKSSINVTALYSSSTWESSFHRLYLLFPSQARLSYVRPISAFLPNPIWCLTYVWPNSKHSFL